MKIACGGPGSEPLSLWDAPFLDMPVLGRCEDTNDTGGNKIRDGGDSGVSVRSGTVFNGHGASLVANDGG